MSSDVLELSEEDIKQGDEVDDGLFHRAHLRCQYDAPRVTLICGITASWVENKETPDNPPCPKCHPPSGIAKCPICGTEAYTL